MAVETGLYRFKDSSTEKYYKIQKLNLHSDFGDQYYISWGGTPECSQGERWFGSKKAYEKQREKTGKGYKLINSILEPIDPSRELIDTILNHHSWVSLPMDQIVPPRTVGAPKTTAKAKKEEPVVDTVKKKSESDLFWEELKKK